VLVLFFRAAIPRAAQGYVVHQGLNGQDGGDPLLSEEGGRKRMEILPSFFGGNVNKP
jgi:hypothetical protein